jgi:hypothetical protein
MLVSGLTLGNDVLNMQQNNFTFEQNSGESIISSARINKLLPTHMEKDGHFYTESVKKEIRAKFDLVKSIR